MILGLSQSSLNKTEVFSRISELQVLAAVFPQITAVPCVISSPLRPDVHPSFSIYLTDKGHVAWKDHARRTANSNGNLMDLLCQYWQCSFQQALDRIDSSLCEDSHIEVRNQIKALTRKEVSGNSELQVTVREWKDYDLEYWQSYGISEKWLKKAEVYPISYKMITKINPKTGNARRYTFAADKYAYVYVERKENEVQLKVYSPFNKEHKWCSKMDRSVISLWTKVPEKGDKLVICSSLKDALCVWANLGIPAVATQGEGYTISDTAVAELKRRYKKVYVSFDTDAPGLEDGRKLSEETGFINIIPDLGKEKDYSDYYKSLKNKRDFKQLKQLFI